MKLGFGLVTCQRYPGDTRTPADLYAQALELARVCEAQGLDSIWLSEHHFWDDDYMPSLLVTAAALAAVTTEITVGTAVLLAPLYHPLRLAEDAATVDLIARGRFILGLGAGWRNEEFDRLGVPMDGVGRRVSEMVKILRASWGAEPFTHRGKVFDLEATNVTPKPTRQIPIWLGGFADDALRRAGRIGDGFIGSSSRGDDFVDRLGLVKEGLAKSGRDESAFTFALHYPVWVGETSDAVRYVHNIRWKYQDMGAGTYGRSSSGPLPEPPELDAETGERIAASMASGSVEEVVAKIERFREVVGDDLHFICRSYLPGVPFEQQLQQVKLLAEVKRALA